MDRDIVECQKGNSIEYNILKVVTRSETELQASVPVNTTKRNAYAKERYTRAREEKQYFYFFLFFIFRFFFFLFFYFSFHLYFFIIYFLLFLTLTVAGGIFITWK